MNTRKLKAKLVEKDVSIADLATILNVNKSTVYRKLNKSGQAFTVSDVDKIAKALCLTYSDINEIFFTNIVAWYATYIGGENMEFVIGYIIGLVLTWILIIVVAGLYIKNDEKKTNRWKDVKFDYKSRGKRIFANAQEKND